MKQAIIDKSNQTQQVKTKNTLVSRNIKKPGRPQKTTVVNVNDRQIISLVKKSLFTKLNRLRIPTWRCVHVPNQEKT